MNGKYVANGIDAPISSCENNKFKLYFLIYYDKLHFYLYFFEVKDEPISFKFPYAI